jgi:aspartyl-tRNA(Asn)/glutamyl-tRNA(Gln) amidotransferase subunit B
MTVKTIIGLEVHVQLMTRTKLFCGCSTKFGLPPNSATCPVCLGLPGSLPVMNKLAFQLALKAALVCNCRINPWSKWDRKSYWYPDLPKGYQISQYDRPYSEDGWIDVDGVKIGIIRSHLEEDAGKLIHEDDAILVDLNRAGMPLVEIVSHPDITSPAQARKYLDLLKEMMLYAEVSDCKMQEGSLRCDANINLDIDGVRTPIVEIKNLNSFVGVEKALEYEEKRQLEEYQRTGLKFGDAPKTTRGWDDENGVTTPQRTKEEAADYRYFPDPDLVDVHVTEDMLEPIRASIPELPVARRIRYTAMGLTEYAVNFVVDQGLYFARYFDLVAALVEPKMAANWCINYAAKRKDCWLRPKIFGELIDQANRLKLSATQSSEVFTTLLDSGGTAVGIIAALGYDQRADSSALDAACDKVIAANAKSVADYKGGKTAAINSLLGQVMKELKGKADASEIKTKLTEKLAT